MTSTAIEFADFVPTRWFITLNSDEPLDRAVCNGTRLMIDGGTQLIVFQGNLLHLFYKLF